MNKLNNILDLMAPIKIIQVRKKYCPWLSETTKLMIKQRNEAQKQANETKSRSDWNYFKTLRNKVNNRLKYEKINWQKDKLDEFSEDSSQTWKNIKGWLGWSTGGPPTKLFYEGKMLTKPKELSETMNSFFVNKVRNLRNKLTNITGDPLALVRKLMQKKLVNSHLRRFRQRIFLK